VANREDERPDGPAAAAEPGTDESRPGDGGVDVEREIQAAREEAAQYKDRWIRERADLENVKRRAARERQEMARYGTEHLIRDLLPVVDDLERAIAAAKDSPGSEQVVSGVELVLKSLLGVLSGHGVERVAATGERFDPTMHEAVSSIPHPTVPEGSVVEEHRGGYRLHDRLVRAAMVTVSQGQGADDLATVHDGD